MTLVAYLGSIAILGVPWVVISLLTTIFDVLPPRIYTGLRLTKENVINLAEGGLCRMCRVCRYPNCTLGGH